MSIVSLVDRVDDARFTSIEQALLDALEDVKNGRGAFANGRKCLVIALDDTDGQYNVSFVNGGMKTSECIALCEVMKTKCLTEMNYIP